MASNSNVDDSLDYAFSRLVLHERQEGSHQASEDAEPLEEDDYEDKQGPFYVHIDFLSNSAGKGPTINSYMLRKYYFDPRRYFNFFDEVFDMPPVVPRPPTLKEMRAACTPTMSKSYYELWKVKGDFSVAEFFEHLSKANFDGAVLRVTCLHDGEHAIYRREF